MAKSPETRREFLKTLIAVGLGLLGIWRFMTPRHARRARAVDVPLADVPPDGALVLPAEGLAIARLGKDEILALDLTCTHLGCRVTATEAGFTCPCHGSHFDERGRVLTGPATESLHVLAVTRTTDVLHIQGRVRS